MTIVKTLIVRKTPKQYRVILRLSGYASDRNGDTVLATFANRAMAIVPMSSALASFIKFLMVDHIQYEGDPEGYEHLVNLGIIEEMTDD